MYAVAEILANRIPTQEEYVGLTPVVAILPWFLAGSLFPITALPGWLAAVARALPTTHTLALLRYGVLNRGGAGLHDIWGLSSTTTDAALSLLVLAGGRSSSPPRPSGYSSGQRSADQDIQPARRIHLQDRRAGHVRASRRAWPESRPASWSREQLLARNEGKQQPVGS